MTIFVYNNHSIDDLKFRILLETGPRRQTIKLTLISCTICDEKLNPRSAEATFAQGQERNDL